MERKCVQDFKSLKIWIDNIWCDHRHHNDDRYSSSSLYHAPQDSEICTSLVGLPLISSPEQIFLWNRSRSMQGHGSSGYFPPLDPQLRAQRCSRRWRSLWTYRRKGMWRCRGRICECNLWTTGWTLMSKAEWVSGWIRRHRLQSARSAIRFLWKRMNSYGKWRQTLRFKHRECTSLGRWAAGQGGQLEQVSMTSIDAKVRTSQIRWTVLALYLVQTKVRRTNFLVSYVLKILSGSLD